jgi:hypothetical protein
MVSGPAIAADLLPPPPPPAAPAVQSAPVPAVKGEVQVTGGVFGVDSGYADRAFVSLQGSLYDEAGFGVHADVTHSMREEDASFVAVGASYAVTPKARFKVMAGTSSQNDDILPELYLNGSLTYDFGPQAGIVVIPEIIYRDYRSGVDELQGLVAINKYFPAFKDGSYIVGSLNGSVNYVNPGDNVGWEAGANLTHVRPYYMSYGIGAVVGRSAYDNTLGIASISVRNDYVGVRPSISMFLSKDVEVFARGEVLWTDYYTLAGGYGGVKYTF